MEFITIDFETATSQRDSPCEIGLTFVQNGQIIGTSNYYESEASRDNGILSVMKNAPDAKIEII